MCSIQNDAGELIEIPCELILQMLPHRYPFLLIDKVFISVPGKSGKGIKNVSVNEPYFTGHFPGRPIVPGVLIVESLAQLIAVIYNSENLDKLKENSDVNIKENIGYLGSVNVKFLSIVQPGDTMVLEAELKQKVQKMSLFEVVARVGDKIVLKGSISVTQQ
jgi:3-hydroxyacyl-[acyl-carrier-protein] dehydratase